MLITIEELRRRFEDDSTGLVNRLQEEAGRYGSERAFLIHPSAFLRAQRVFLFLQPSSPPTDSLPACVRGLTHSLPLLSASRLDPSMSLASLRLHSPCPPTHGLAVARRTS
jgi:hypothetical protein